MKAKIQIMESENDSYYEYAVFDGHGNCVNKGFFTKEKAERYCEAYRNSRIYPNACVMRRLVMAWEAIDNDE